MTRYTGVTVEEAIKNGLEDLGLPRMKVSIKVLAREKSGFLGFGKKPAEVEMAALKLDDSQTFEKELVKEDIFEETSGNEEAASQTDEDMAQVLSKLEETGKLSVLFPRDLAQAGAASESENSDLDLEPVEDVAEESEEAYSELTEEEGVEVIAVEEEAPASLPAQEEVLEDSSLPAYSEPKFVVQERSSLEEEQMDQAKAYLVSVLAEMDVEAEVTASISRRTIYFQIDTNEPGRVIGYHGKVLKSLQLLAQNYLYNLYGRTLFISINVNDYVEHRAEVLQSYAQKLAQRVIDEGRAIDTDPMSNSERKIIHRIISKIDGVTSYSEGDEPNRYVVVDIDEQD